MIKVKACPKCAHFVLAKNSSDCQDLVISNPGKNSTLPMSGYVSQFQGISGIRVFSVTNQKSRSSTGSVVVLSSNSLASLLYVDSSGLRAGYDPLSDSVYHECSEVSYFVDGLNPDSTEVDSLPVLDTIPVAETANLYFNSTELELIQFQVYPTDTNLLRLEVYRRDSGTSLEHFSEIIDTLPMDTSTNLWLAVGDTSAGPTYIRRLGDVNESGEIDIVDLTYMVAYMFKGGPAPEPNDNAGNVNCSGSLDIVDLTYLVSFMFRSGPEPGCH